MAMRPPKRSTMRVPGGAGGGDAVQKTGLFSGCAQAGPARPRRAHALAEELLTRGCMFINSQVWDEAAREFRKAIKMEPDYAEAYNNLGLCLIYADQPAEAIPELEMALEHFSGWSVAEANMGLAYQKMGKHPEAATWFNKSLAHKRNQPAVWLALGDSLSVQGKHDDALNAYNVAIELSPKYDMAFHRVGMIHARRNNMEEAEAALRKALELDDQNYEAMAVLGAISARKGNIGQAREMFSNAQNAEKVPLTAQKGMRRLQIFDNGLRGAFKEWQGKMPEVPTLAECYYSLGLAHLKAGDEYAAKEAFRHAADGAPDWMEPMVWFGFFSALDGDAVAAKEYWDKALALQPKNGMLREQLGYLATAMGLQKEAEAQFGQAQQLGRKIPPEAIKPDGGTSA